jgi:hypothetical protein
MAAITNLTIANMALSHIGAKVTLAAFPTAASTGIINQSVLLWYDASRRQILEAYDWSFARKKTVAALAAHADDPDEGLWAYRFDPPSDALAIRRIVNPTNVGSNAIPYENEISETSGTMSVQTNVEETKVVYTFDQEDPTLYSEFFTEALSHLLAANISFPITRKRSLKGDHLGLYRQLLPTAAAFDANERQEDEPRDAPWIRDR